MKELEQRIYESKTSQDRETRKPFALYFAKKPSEMPGYSVSTYETGTTGSSGTQKDD